MTFSTALQISPEGLLQSTKGITSWRCPQYCTRDIVVCQAKLNNRLTYLVSMYLDIDIMDFPPKFKELILKQR